MKVLHFKYFRLLAFWAVAVICIFVLHNFVDQCNFDKVQILSTLISIISIILAIIVTYLFSKLFSEKSIRLERKRSIDKFAYQVTNLRKIAFHIRGMYEFWRFQNMDIKSIIDKKYKSLTYEYYRGETLPRISHEEFQKVDEDIRGSVGQAYLALKGLENGDQAIEFFSKFNPENYSLEDLERFRAYAQSFSYFLDQSDDKIVHFQAVKPYSMRFIEELYALIKNEPIDRTNYKRSIKDLFTYFESHIFDRIIYLTALSSNAFPTTLKSSFRNMLVFLCLLIATIFVSLLSFQTKTDFILSVMLVSLFIANTIDLILLTYTSITQELKIEEIQEV